MISGNRGEWSELYVSLQILASGQIECGDNDLRPLPGSALRIDRLVRGNGDSMRKFEIGANQVSVTDKGGTRISEISRLTVGSWALALQQHLLNWESGPGSRSIPEMTEAMEALHLIGLGAGSGQKSDLQLALGSIDGQQSDLGFTVKSFLGARPSLFNASRATRFTYAVEPDADELTLLGARQIKTKALIEYLTKHDLRLRFDSVQDVRFRRNLGLVDSEMPKIAAAIVLGYYSGLGVRVSDIVRRLREESTPEWHSEAFNIAKVKDLLAAMAFGFSGVREWDGELTVRGGFLAVLPDARLVAFVHHNWKELRDFLYASAELDTPSTSRHEHGSLVRCDGAWTVDLALQVRLALSH